MVCRALCNNAITFNRIIVADNNSIVWTRVCWQGEGTCHWPRSSVPMLWVSTELILVSRC